MKYRNGYRGEAQSALTGPWGKLSSKNTHKSGCKSVPIFIGRHALCRCCTHDEKCQVQDMNQEAVKGILHSPLERECGVYHKRNCVATIRQCVYVHESVEKVCAYPQITSCWHVSHPDSWKHHIHGEQWHAWLWNQNVYKGLEIVVRPWPCVCGIVQGTGEEVEEGAVNCCLPVWQSHMPVAVLDLEMEKRFMLDKMLKSFCLSVWQSEMDKNACRDYTDTVDRDPKHSNIDTVTHSIRMHAHTHIHKYTP